MKISLCSQSYFTLNLEDAIVAVGEAGYDAIELACTPPHFDVVQAKTRADETIDRIRNAGLAVSALSIFNTFTDPALLDKNVAETLAYIRLAPRFSTRIVRLIPGQPASAKAEKRHWGCLEEAISVLLPVSRNLGIRLAFETHMRQLTDTISTSRRLLDMATDPLIGLTFDPSNIAFAGEDPVEAIDVFGDRIYNVHIKNGIIDANGNWNFGCVDSGLTDYGRVLPKLIKAGYEGYLAVECLQPGLAEAPVEIAKRDLHSLQALIDRIGL